MSIPEIPNIFETIAIRIFSFGLKSDWKRTVAFFGHALFGRRESVAHYIWGERSEYFTHTPARFCPVERRAFGCLGIGGRVHELPSRVKERNGFFAVVEGERKNTISEEKVALRQKRVARRKDVTPGLGRVGERPARKIDRRVIGIEELDIFTSIL